MHEEIFKLLVSARAVVVYRSSPGQKAEVVKFMKNRVGSKTILAIGDGANDVNMIQSAHIGFGLFGKEGNQAAAFADYAIPRFQDLRRALFWHGRPLGYRMIVMANLIIYKSIVKSSSNYALNIFNGFSGFQAVGGIMHMFFNIFNTTFANFFVCIYDQDVSREKYGTLEKEKLMPVPMSEWYNYSRIQCNRWRFIIRMLIFDIYALITGFGIFFIFYYN